jgi:hypothetical protein
MPAYEGNSQAVPLINNRQIYLWNNESPAVNGATGSLSISVELQRVNQSFYPWGLSFEAWFSGAPGAFEIDIMGSNTDTGSPSPGNYVKIGSITTVNGSNVGRWDMPSNVWPKYVAGYLLTLTNPVSVTLQVTK